MLYFILQQQLYEDIIKCDIRVDILLIARSLFFVYFLS